jgi:ABC-2 type transport system permease protein
MMTWRDTFWHEWRTRLGQPASLLCLLAFVAVMIFAAISGRMARDARAAAIAQHESQSALATASWLADLKALETGGDAAGIPPWSASPMDFEFASSLRPAPLADFSIGQADLLPSLGKVSLWDPDVRLFSRYEFDDPSSLALGSLDVSKALVLMLPLLMIVLSFDVLSAERDKGRLGLLLAQGTDLRRLFWQRLTIRGGVAVTLALAVAAAAFLLNGGPVTLIGRLPAFSVWCAAACLYAVSWLAIIAFVASGNRPGESNAIRLLLCWAGLTLIVPAAVIAVTETIYPPPSRLAYLAEARRVEIETERAEGGIAQGFFNDHPELVVDSTSEMPAYLRTAYFVTSTVDKATRPILDSFENTATRREEALGVFRYVSPAIVAHGVFNEAAGTSAARHRRYMAQARAFKGAYAGQAGPYIAAGRLMPSDRVIRFPRFTFEDLPFGAVLANALPALAFLTLLAGALLLFADRRLRRSRASTIDRWLVAR